MNTLKLALDWTPNINHIGFFVAREKGYYQAHGLAVDIIDPAMDNYAVTPAKKVELGQADLALCPTESVVSYQTKSTPFSLVGIATIFQEDLSGIAVNADVGIQSPKDLDGKSYASYQARYEDEIVRQMIRNDGGQGEIKVDYPTKLGIWETLLTGAYDSTWIFLNWEGVEADGAGAPLHYFKMQDYDVPYSYSPLIVGNRASINANETAFQAFLAATRKGFLHAIEQPDEAVALLKPFVPEKDANIDLRRALELSAEAMGGPEVWGRMDEGVVNRFLQWLNERQLESTPLTASDIVTNRLINAVVELG